MQHAEDVSPSKPPTTLAASIDVHGSTHRSLLYEQVMCRECCQCAIGVMQGGGFIHQ